MRPALSKRLRNTADFLHGLRHQIFRRCPVFRTGQQRFFRPGLGHFREKCLQMRQRCFRQLAVSGQLAAEHRQQRRLTLRLPAQGKGIITRHSRRIIRLIIAQRAHPRKGAKDISSRQLPFKMVIADIQQIHHFFLGYLNLIRIAQIFFVGRADEGIAA